MKLVLAIVAACSLLPLPIAAQKAVLTDKDIDDAIAAGLKGKGHGQGLGLSESERFLDGLSSTSSHGYSVIVYTPITWIRQQATLAAKEYRVFTREQVTDDMRESVLRVVVHPDRPRVLDETGRAYGSSAQHVVIRDDAKKTVIQPASKNEIPEEVTNGLGGKQIYQRLELKFPLDAVREVRGDRNREFFITVIGDAGGEKDFKIKQKHFERIP